MSRTDERLNSCHCCEGVRILTPAEHANRPGLSALAYRVGTHGSFAATMQARIGAMPALGALGTRDDTDFTVALIDAWATVADALSFYTEHIANQGFLLTATEFRSTQELARSIGYEPHPGVAASTSLAFTVEDSPGAAEEVPIPAGTRAQSSPDGDELPQTFETTEELLAHPEWNALRPRSTEPQLFDRDTRVFYFEGTDTRLNAGDWMLLRAGKDADPKNPGDIESIPLQVMRVEPDFERQHTRVELVRPQGPLPRGGGSRVAAAPEAAPQPPPSPTPGVAEIAPPPDVFTEPLPLSADSAAKLATAFTWSADDTELLASMHFIDEGAFAKYVNKSAVDPKPAKETAVFAMRVKTAPFGHNAPRWQTLPSEWRSPPPDGSAIYEINWDRVDVVDRELDSWEITRAGATPEGVNRSYKEIYGSDEDDDVILLEAAFSEILPVSWVVLVGSGNHPGLASFRVTKVEELSRSDFALNSLATALSLEPQEDEASDISDFRLRTTSIYAQSEPLPLAGKPIDDPVQDDIVELDHMLENQVRSGQPVIVSGTPTGLEGIVESELAIVKEAIHVAGYTKLVFERKLQRAYRRDSVRLNANIAAATHGESRKEVLGGGDASQSFQTFQLSHAPLTYVSAPVPGGAQSTLDLRVNGVLWEEAPNLLGLGPDDRRYTLRRDDEGKTTVAFGDGRTGQRLPTDFENVSASYKNGLGVAGNLPADKITLLASQPRYVQAVTNPVPAQGGADPESSTDTRRNAPNSLRTFGRIVSLQDFEDFARAFAGVAKAQARLLQLGEAKVVHVTVAGENGELVPPDSDLYQDLVEAMDRYRDPFQRLLVESYQKRFFDVTAKVRVHEDYQVGIVLNTVEKSLREVFSFQRRELGQGVTLSEVVAVMQRVRGVEAIDVDLLHFSHLLQGPLHLGKNALLERRQPARTVSTLPARPARRTTAGTVLPAQHLSIHHIRLLEMS